MKTSASKENALAKRKNAKILIRSRRGISLEPTLLKREFQKTMKLHFLRCQLSQQESEKSHCLFCLLHRVYNFVLMNKFPHLPNKIIIDVYPENFRQYLHDKHFLESFFIFFITVFGILVFSPFSLV